MFVLLEFIHKEMTFKEKIYDLFSSPDILLERIETETGLAFFKMQVSKHKGKLPFDTICDVLGPLKDFVILKEGQSLPQDCPLSLFKGNKLRKKLLFNSAVYTIGLMGVSPFSSSVTVVDRQGVFIDDIEKIVFLCSEIRIVTDEKRKYMRLSHHLLEKYGVTLLFSDNAETFCKDSSFFISDQGNEIPLGFSGIAFSGEKKIINGKLFYPGEVDLPLKYKRLCPEGFDEKLFAFALYERCAVKELEKTKYKDLLT